MKTGNETHALHGKLAAPLTKIVDQHKGKISALLASGGASTLKQALGKDDNIRKVATFCYPLMPGLLRLVVKEARFIDFVMHNREKLLAHLVAATPASTVDVPAQAAPAPQQA